MAEPIVAKPRCDLLGCGEFAVTSTDGTEIDSQGLNRPALPKLNVCARHLNWPHSDDARVFATTAPYLERK